MWKIFVLSTQLVGHPHVKLPVVGRLEILPIRESEAKVKCTEAREAKVMYIEAKEAKAACKEAKEAKVAYKEAK